MTIGIYSIGNKVTTKVYIGSSRNIERRWQQHRSALRLNRHANPHLQAAWNKYGEKAFEFEIVEVCEDAQDATRREQEWLDFVLSNESELTYNLANTVGPPMVGRKHSEQTKAKMSAAKKGRVLSEEQKEKLRGRRFSEETKARMSAAQKGVPKSGEARAKMSAAHKGVPMSPETRLKMSESRRAYLARKKEEGDKWPE